MTDKTGNLRTNSASGVGGKDYYSQVDELVHASQNEFKALAGKLGKDWLMCLLKDTVDHLEKNKPSSTLFESINTKIDEVVDVLVNKFDNISPHPEATCKMTTI